ncbi:MAG: hypothetical protein K1X89_10140 [Myxococcaceae bacterium]|nr:hypothetical protein [Myxococcaceae bacterium]
MTTRPEDEEQVPTRLPQRLDRERARRLLRLALASLKDEPQSWSKPRPPVPDEAFEDD